MTILRRHAVLLRKTTRLLVSGPVEVCGRQEKRMSEGVQRGAAIVFCGDSTGVGSSVPRSVDWSRKDACRCDSSSES